MGVGGIIGRGFDWGAGDSERPRVGEGEGGWFVEYLVVGGCVRREDETMGGFNVTIRLTLSQSKSRVRTKHTEETPRNVHATAVMNRQHRITFVQFSSEAETRYHCYTTR